MLQWDLSPCWSVHSWNVLSVDAIFLQEPGRTHRDLSDQSRLWGQKWVAPAQEVTESLNLHHQTQCRSTTAWLRPRLFGSRPNPPVALFLVHLQWQLLPNCLLHWVVQDVGAAGGAAAASGLESVLWLTWCVLCVLSPSSAFGTNDKTINFISCTGMSYPSSLSTPCTLPLQMLMLLTEPACSQWEDIGGSPMSLVLWRSPFFYAASHCTGLETASRAKEGGQRHQHLVHICPTAQLSPTGEAEAKGPNEAEKNSYTPDIKGMASFHLLRG